MDSQECRYAHDVHPMTFISADQLKRCSVLLAIIFAGELIFSLPFHIARFFRPTFLSVFELSNTGLGNVFAVYGLTAALAYFPGGFLADYFSARKLMSVSLLATAIGGLYLAQIPQSWGLAILFAYWGATTVLLFWAAMIKATREWGGSSTQGSAFGFLDGGRGLVAAVAASVGVGVLSLVLPDDINNISADQRREALQIVIYFYAFMTASAAAVVWFLVADTKRIEGASFGRAVNGMAEVFKNSRVWLQALVVVCAYCAYKGLDNFALYAVDVLRVNEVEAARLTSYAAYFRPLSAVAAGFIANKISATRVIAIGFVLLLFSYSFLSFYGPGQTFAVVVYTNIALTFCAVFALRGVYFALLDESSLDAQRTGAAVGIISLIGFTPDMFFAPIAGRILDASPGVEGHQHFFALLIVISFIGLLAVIGLRAMCKRISQSIS